MIDYLASFTNTDGSAFPDTEAVNVTAPGSGDGTEFVAILVNDIWGRAQAIMNYAGLTPDGVTEADGTAQILEALSRGWAIGPGMGVIYWKNGTPAANGDRVLLLQGQGVLVASFPLLVAECYVGDANNAAVAAGGGFFYKADNADGSSPNTAGIYFILPETRGYALRGLDAAAAVDPDGASRYLGDVQADAIQYHDHFKFFEGSSSSILTSAETPYRQGTGASVEYAITSDGSSAADRGLSNGDPQTQAGKGAVSVDSETRIANVSTNFGITY